MGTVEIDWFAMNYDIKAIFGNHKNYKKFKDCMARRQLINFMYQTRQVPIYEKASKS